MPRVNIGDGELHYEITGDGPPLMLVSGLGGAGAYWKPLLPAFSRRYRVVTYDHRGTGQSERSRIAYSVEQMTRDHLALMDRLGIERADFVGHSTGGAIGQIVAIERPERLRSLVISSSWTKNDPVFSLAFDVRKTILATLGAEAYQKASLLMMYPPWWVRDHAAELRADIAASVPSFPPPEIMLSRIDAILAFDRTGELGTIRTPTLVICAEDDTLTPAYFSRELAERIPGATLEVLKTGGHLTAKTVPDEFTEKVLAFLQGV